VKVGWAVPKKKARLVISASVSWPILSSLRKPSSAMTLATAPRPRTTTCAPLPTRIFAESSVFLALAAGATDSSSAEAARLADCVQ
jgi:hypothetical protein